MLHIRQIPAKIPACIARHKYVTSNHFPLFTLSRISRGVSLLVTALKHGELRFISIHTQAVCPVVKEIIYKPPLKVTKLCQPKLCFKLTTWKMVNAYRFCRESSNCTYYVYKMNFTIQLLDMKTFLRTTTCEERLNGLALAYIHWDINVNLERVLQKWDGSGHRIHLAFASAIMLNITYCVCKYTTNGMVNLLRQKFWQYKPWSI